MLTQPVYHFNAGSQKLTLYEKHLRSDVGINSFIELIEIRFEDDTQEVQVPVI